MPKVNPHADPTRRDLGPAALGRTVKKLFSYYPVLAPVTFVCILFSSIVSSVPSLFTQNIIQIIEKWYISRDWAAAKAEIVPYLTLLVVLYALSILSMTVYTQLMAYMTQGFLHKLRCEMFGGMQQLPIRYFDSHQHGDIMSHYTNDIDTLRQLVSQALPALIQSGAIVLVVFSIMLYLQPLADSGARARHHRHGRGHEEDRRRQREILRPPAEGGRLHRGLHSGDDERVRRSSRSSATSRRASRTSTGSTTRFLRTASARSAYANVLGPIIGNIGNILYVVVARRRRRVPAHRDCRTCQHLRQWRSDISILVPFLNMTKQFTGNVNQLSQQINAVVMGMAGAERIFALMDEKPEADDGYVTLVNAKMMPERHRDRVRPSAPGIWAWKHPHRRTAPSPTPQLQRRRAPVRCGLRLRARASPCCTTSSLYAEPGQKVAFVGATGAGKTTITNLINRFYDIADGKIRYDGININKIKKADLRRSLGIVLQDTNLFTGHGHGQHPLRPSGRDGRGVHRGGKARRRGRLHHAPAGGLRHAC